MTDNLRSTRLAAAWGMVGFVGLSELSALIDWIGALDEAGPLKAFTRGYLPTGLIIFLPILAVVLTAFVPPAIAYARPIALIAYIQYAFMVIWNALLFVNYVLARLTPADEYGIPTPVLSPPFLIATIGVAVLAAVGAFASWQVYRALDPLAADIADLEEQIEELRDEDEPTSNA